MLASRRASSHQSSSPKSSTATTKGSRDAFTRMNDSVCLEGGVDDSASDSSSDSQLSQIHRDKEALEQEKQAEIKKAADWYLVLRKFKKPRRKNYRFTIDGELPEMIGDKRREDVELALSELVGKLKELEQKEKDLDRLEKERYQFLKVKAEQEPDPEAHEDYDEDEDDALQQAAGDEFIIWEPKGSKNKL